MKRISFVVVWTGLLLFLVLVVSRTNLLNFPSASAVEDHNAKSLPEKPSPVGRVSDAGLTERINRLIDESSFTSARWGVAVISLSDGSTLYGRDADKLFTPASNMKIYTTAVALDLLGADYRWRTSIYAASQPEADGTVQGDLILYGRGAPDLVARNRNDNEASLAKLADDLYARGIRRIKGNIVGDASYFRGNPLGDGWQWTDLQWYFGAEASALSINENEIDVNISPARNSKEPASVKASDGGNFVTIQNRVVPASGSTRATIGMNRGLSDNDIVVWGEFPVGGRGFGARLSVHNPAAWASKLLLTALRERGITVDGQSTSRDAQVAISQRFDPSKAVELASISSQPLSEIAKKTNKESNNLFAELILRTLGRERGAMLEIPEPPGRERGDEEAGVALVRLWLSRAGISTAGLAIHDGSGLSRLDLVTPHTSARLLAAILKTASGSTFKQTLPISGVDGTLGGRLKSVTDRVHAKTGSLTYDNSLSGYLTTADGQELAFSIMCNDQTGSASSIRLIDEIVTTIASPAASPPEKLRKSQ